MKFLLVILAGLSISKSTLAAEYIVSITEKQEDKYKNRWTLSDWFETKRKTRMQDMWLAANTRRSPYEFELAYDSGVLEVEDGPIARVGRSRFGAYANFVGLEGTLVSDEVLGDGWDAAFHLRLFGDSVQNGNLTLSYGIRNRETDTESFQNQFYQASVTIYFIKSLGITGMYRKVMASEGDLETSIEGSRVDVSAHIEFSFIRPYVTLTQYTQETTAAAATSPTESERTGYSVGLSLFF